ncbi:mis18-binding protein 1 isoform X2 [Melanotaenia boesemani]|uniref:mis18-binding protein 1 isoform X2 n=1 Tax=Melanotaenia boesemani TaxID=1250792 RepID=UPI001C04271C|nr:mis18-binding protein 1 isoform X2 [Melanotaenia boesemani]
MASFNLLQHADRNFQSPAKVFAMLKSKVQKEAKCAKEGLFISQDISCNVSETHGAELYSPRENAANSRIAEELNENNRNSSYRNEAQALTLSPISSPKKYTCSVISGRRLEETSPGNENVRGYTRRDRFVMESTAISQSLSVVNRNHIIDTGGLNVPNRTPVKRPVENYGKNVLYAKCGPLSKAMSPGKAYSPVENSLRKWEQQQFRKNCRITERNDDMQSPQQRKTSAQAEDYTNNNSCMQDFGGLSSNQPEMLHEPMFPPRSPIGKCLSVIQRTLPTMSPAKMFAYMKERENKKEQQDVQNSCKMDLFGPGNLHHSGDAPLSTAHNRGEMENIALESVKKRELQIRLCRIDSDVFPSDPGCSADVSVPAAPPQPVLLEDSQLLNSPQISIPKAQDSMFKRSCGLKQKKIPLENVIYLRKWFLRKNHQGLFVNGIHDEDNIPWNSNIIVDRISNSVLKTVSGRVYILVGNMKMDVASEFPKWLLKKFASGFPQNWKTLYEKFLQESKETERKNDRKDIKAKTNPEASSIIRSVKGHKQRSTRTPEFFSPTHSFSTQVSRSGRLIKPPLDYWKGARVILDAQMNVIVHEGYDTFQSDTSVKVSPRATPKPVCVIVPSCSKQGESAKDKRTSVPEKRVNEVRNSRKAVVSPYKKPTTLIEPTVEMLSSPEEWCGRRTTSSQRERRLYVNAAPQKQSEPSTGRLKQTHGINRPSECVSARKRNVTNSPESSPAPKKTEHLLSDEEFSSKEKKPVQQVHHKKHGKYYKKSPKRSPKRSKKGREAQGMRTREARQRDEAQKGKSSSKPFLRSQQSSQKAHTNKGSAIIPQDEDEWTEAELMALQKAVSYYPKYATGYWANVARMVGTRSAEECHKQHTSLGTYRSPAKRASKKVAAPKPPVAERPVISARVGTLKRKQQVRQFLESQPREDMDDAFSSAYMQNKRFEIPSLCLSDDCNFQMSDMEPQTPMSSHYPEVKTPQCLLITPGMMGSPNANRDDKYVYQLQKRMKKNQFDVCKNSPSSKKFTPTPSLKRRMRRCGNTENDSLVVFEMLGENNGAPSESEEEEDYYFSDN